MASCDSRGIEESCNNTASCTRKKRASPRPRCPTIRKPMGSFLQPLRSRPPPTKKCVSAQSRQGGLVTALQSLGAATPDSAPESTAPDLLSAQPRPRWLRFFRPEISYADAKNFGPARNFVACSNAYASLISFISLFAGPKNDNPTGKPRAKPAGTDMFG